MSYSIESERLLLRPFTIADAESYFQMTSDATIRKYVPYCWNENLEETQELILDYYSRGDFTRDFYVVIEDKISHQLVGAIIAVALRTKPLELDMAILIDAKHRQKGYMSEALEAFTRSVPKPAYLSFMIEKDNIASLKTVAKLPNIQEIPISGKTKEHERAFVLALK
ncbi:MAG: GNAT family N-acetyltransferase [Clostridia bacterium]|nr:GNAT family N-acetyltransferase [Clostridia bacterium]MBQ7882510.1 GNAT family N-acetyltransferase [Treponema sp.]